jgi:HAD superfamily hydrolase (TIGR01458 family)
MEDISDFVGTINMDPPHNCVVVGLAPTKFEYLHLNQAYKILQEYPDNLIAIHRGNYIKTEEDGSSGFSLGPGAFVAALEAASSGTTAKVMGKPSLEFFQSVLWNEVEAAEVCMVGDDVIGDIQGAQQAGIGTTILVQTGKYRMGDESKCAPTIMVPSIVEAVDYILSHSQGKSS